MAKRNSLTSPAFTKPGTGRQTQQVGEAGFDNIRDNIDDHIKTKVINSKESYVDTIQFNIDFTDGQSEGRLQWNTEDGTLEVGMPGGNVNLQIGQEMLVRVQNEESIQINNGEIVYASSAVGNIKKVKLANADNHDNALKVVGVATENILPGQMGYITTTGLVRDFDTSSFTDGQLVFLDTTDGQIRGTPPTAPNTTVVVGIIVRPHATEGIMYARIQAISYLEELSDTTITNITDGDILEWNASNNRWENRPTSYGNMYQHDSGTLVTISTINTPVRVGGMTSGIKKQTGLLGDHSLVIERAGNYKIDWSISFEMAGGANQEIEGSVFLANSTFAIQASAHRKATTAGDKGNMGATCILFLPENQQVSLAVLNETSTNNIIIDHANLSLTFLDG